MGTVSRLPEKIRTIVPIIQSETEASDSVHGLIRRLSPANDGRLSPFPAIVDSGLLGITVPPEHGGADVSNVVLGEIVMATAAANRTAAACLASHFHSVELLRGSDATGACGYFYARALAGDIFLMIGAIDGINDGSDLRLVPEIGKPGLRLNGTVESEIDPIHADWIVIRAAGEACEHAVIVPRMTAGLRLSPDRISFSNVHVDADCFVQLANPAASTAAPLDDMLQSAQRLGWAERELDEKVARHAPPAVSRRVYGAGYLSALGRTVSHIESGKVALERAGRNLDAAQVNTDADAMQKAAFSAAIALSSAAEAFDLASGIGSGFGTPESPDRMDPYGHAPLGARLLENAVH